jgi:hypothetical protein
MAERYFQNRADACTFAKETAVSTKAVTKIQYKDGLWVVEGKTVAEAQSDTLPSSIVLTDAEMVSIINKIRQNLELNENVNDLLNLLDINYKKISTAGANLIAALSESDRKIYKDIPIFLTGLSNASFAIEDLPYVKSKEHAIEMAYRFQELATIFSDYGVAPSLRRHRQSMLEASGKYPSESVAKKNAELSQKISRLESNAGPCKCGNGRFVIRESGYGYFWGCSNHPRCWFKRSLTNPEMDVLGV